MLSCASDLRGDYNERTADALFCRRAGRFGIIKRFDRDRASRAGPSQVPGRGAIELGRTGGFLCPRP